MLNEHQAEQNTFGVLALQKSVNGLDFQLAAFSRYSTLHFVPDTIGDLVFNGIASDVYRRGFANGLQGDGAYKLNDAHTLRAGFTVDGESTQNSNISTVLPLVGGVPVDAPFTVTDNSSKLGWIAGVYVQDEWKITNQLTVNFGLRFDQMWQYVDANQLSPRVNVVYKPLDGTTLHAGYARYFTPPPQAIAAPANIAPFANTTAQPDTFQQSPVLPERAHYFDAGIVQRITPQLEVGLDAYYKISQDLLDDGQFGAALILSGFNYEKAYNSGVELSANYKDGNFSAYGNLAWARQVATNIVSNQYLFGADELAYIASNYINTDHAQQWTGSAGASYLWHDTRFSASMVYGSGLRSGFRQHRSRRALRHGQYRHLARDQAARRQAGHGPLRCRECLRHHLRAQGRLGHRRIRAAIRRCAAAILSGFRRNCEGSRDEPNRSPFSSALLAASARTQLARAGPAARRRSSGLAARHRNDAADGNFDFQLHSAGDAASWAAVAARNGPDVATSNCQCKPYRYLAASREDQRSDEILQQTDPSPIDLGRSARRRTFAARVRLRPSCHLRQRLHHRPSLSPLFRPL